MVSQQPASKMIIIATFFHYKSKKVSLLYLKISWHFCWFGLKDLLLWQQFQMNFKPHLKNQKMYPYKMSKILIWISPLSTYKEQNPQRVSTVWCCLHEWLWSFSLFKEEFCLSLCLKSTLILFVLKRYNVNSDIRTSVWTMIQSLK